MQVSRCGSAVLKSIWAFTDSAASLPSGKVCSLTDQATADWHVCSLLKDRRLYNSQGLTEGWIDEWASVSMTWLRMVPEWRNWLFRNLRSQKELLQGPLVPQTTEHLCAKNCPRPVQLKRNQHKWHSMQILIVYTKAKAVITNHAINMGFLKFITALSLALFFAIICWLSLCIYF